MTGPRDPVPRYAVPVNYETGLELSDRQQHHLKMIAEAGELLYAAMHNADGSAIPEESPHREHFFGSRRMAVAGDYLEIALMMARKAALETK